MTDLPEETPTGPELTARRPERQVRLAFSDYQSRDDYVAEYLIKVRGEGLAAVVPVITSVGGDDLPRFVDNLSESFRGWAGVRRWRSLEDQLQIEATWLNGGHVVLRFHLRPSTYDMWTVSVDITLEAGEETKQLGVDLHVFFAE